MKEYGLWVLGLLLLFALSPLYAQEDIVFEGVIDDTSPSASFSVELNAGDVIGVYAVPVDGDLDPTIEIREPDGDVGAYNDNATPDTVNATVFYTAPESGIYTVIVGRYTFEPTSGSFLLTIEFLEEEPSPSVADWRGASDGDRYALSGSPRTYETEHFIIHYTLSGDDATTERYAEVVGQVFEYAWQLQVEELGWPPPPPDDGRGGDDRYDVYIGNVLGRYGSALAYASPDADLAGDNPFTEEVEDIAAPSHIVIENGFTEIDESTLDMLYTTAAHEFNHAIQFNFDFMEPHTWYFEATAVWIETISNRISNDAWEYSDNNLSYNEVCFGTVSEDPSSSLIYGDWLLLQSLVDRYGAGIIQTLWREISQYDGFNALGKALERYGDSVPDALERYRLQNLLGDYKIETAFVNTLTLTSRIHQTGVIHAQTGVQELGANYYDVRLPRGLYRVNFESDAGLHLWAVGILGDVAELTNLEQGGVIDTDAYDFNYLVVFNPNYDNDVDSCRNAFYTITISPVEDEGVQRTAPSRTLSAEKFRPIR